MSSMNKKNTVSRVPAGLRPGHPLELTLVLARLKTDK
jgi:hypothetical protein